jgi:hypothetical protein
MVQDGWQAMLEWIKSKLSMEVRDEELEARQAMMDRTCRQGDKTVTQFVNALQRATRKIQHVTEKERIVWFLDGLNTGLAHFCKCDPRGRPWDSYQGLTEHAKAKETELLSRKEKKDGGDKGKDRRFEGDRGRDAQRYQHGKPWTPKPDRRTDYALAVSLDPPQVQKGSWTPSARNKDRDDQEAKRMRQRSPSPAHQSGRGGGMSGHGRDNHGNRPGPKDWTKEFPGPARAKATGKPWLTNEQAIFCGQQGICFNCYKSRNDCPDKATCPHKRAALNLNDVVRNAPTP